MVKAAKISYEKNIALKMKDDSKIFWKFVKSKTPKKDMQCIIEENKEIHSENKKAELLNTFLLAYQQTKTVKPYHFFPLEK